MSQCQFWLHCLPVRFRTDCERLPGVERLAILSYCDSAMLTSDLDNWEPLEGRDLSLKHFVACRYAVSICQWFPDSCIMNLCSFQGETSMRPFSIAFVKGWRRSLMMLTALEGILVNNISMEDVSSTFKARQCQTLAHSNLGPLKVALLQESVRAVYCTVTTCRNPREVVWANRGGSTQLFSRIFQVYVWC